MAELDEYTVAAFESCRLITEKYSTSFSSAISLVAQPKRNAIYAIYGYVRIADELVDSWRPKNMSVLLGDFEAETFSSITHTQSLNPVVHAFALTVNRYKINHDLIKAFLTSMRMDIQKRTYTKAEYERYIYGSAEAVGLMCLAVFCDGKVGQYNKLVRPARALGSAFQKVNFLRDLKADNAELGRMYFPDMNLKKLDENEKNSLVEDIQNDFRIARVAMKNLPQDSRSAVWLATSYYVALTNKIARTDVETIKHQRVRVSDLYKLSLLVVAKIRSTIGW